MEEVWGFCRVLTMEMCEAAAGTRQQTSRPRAGLSAQLAGRRRRELLGVLLKGPVLGKRRQEREVKTPSKQGTSPAPRPASSEKGTKRPDSSQSDYSPPPHDSPLRRSFIREFREWANKDDSDAFTVSLRRQAEELWADRCTEGRKWQTWMGEVATAVKEMPRRLAGLYGKIRSAELLVPQKSRLEQAIACVTVNQLVAIQRISKPSPEVEVTGLAFFLLIAALEGAQVLTLHRNAWKALQVYLKQPGKCLLALKRTPSLLASPHSSLLTQLQAQLTHIDEHSLKGVEGSPAAISLLRYLKSVLAHNSLEEEESKEIPSPPLDESAESPDSAGRNRGKMLNSLYQRTFSAGNLRQDSEEDLPRLSFGDQDPFFSPYFPNNSQDEVAPEDQMAEISLPSYSPHESDENYREKEEGAATARFPAREDDPETALQRSKSSLKVRNGPEKRETQDPESTWSRLIREKMFLCGCIGQVLDLKSALLQEYRKLLDAHFLSRVEMEQLVSRASDPERYREEVAKAHMAWEKAKVGRKPAGLNWTQLQIQRDKLQLEKGIQRLAKRK